MEEGIIASVTWDACETCKRWNYGEGCDVPEHQFSVTYDPLWEGVKCDAYEQVETGGEQ